MVPETPELLLTVSHEALLVAVQLTFEVMEIDDEDCELQSGAQLEELMESWGTKAACVTVIVLVWL